MAKAPPAPPSADPAAPRRRWRLWPIIVLTAMFALIAAAFIVARNASDVLRGLAESALGSPPARLAIGQLELAGLGRITLRDVTLSDREGVWATAPRIDIRWNPRELWNRTAHIEAVLAERLIVSRLPKPEPARQEPAPLDWPRTPVTVLLDRLEVKQLSMPLPEGAAEGWVAARLALMDGSLSAALNGERTDGVPDRFSLRAGISEAEREIVLRVVFRSETHGFATRWLAEAGLAVGPEGAQLVIDGAGTPEDWKGRIAGYVADVADVEARLVSLEADDGFDLSLTGALTLNPVMLDAQKLPPDIRNLADDRLLFTGLTVIRAGAPEDARLSVASAGEDLVLRLAGQRPWREWQVAFKARPQKPVIDGMTFDAVSLDGRISPPDIGALEANFDLQVDNLIGSDFALPQLRGHFDLAFHEGRLALRGKGRLHDVMTAVHENLALPSALDFALGGMWDGQDRIVIDNLVLANDTFRATAQGNWNLAAPSGVGTATLELADLAAASNNAIGGRARLDLKAQSRDGLDIVIDGRAEELSRPDNPDIGRLNPVTLRGRVTYGAKGGAADLELASPAVTVTADAMLDEDQRLHANLRAVPGDGEVVAALIGRPMADDAELTARVRGTLKAPDISARLVLPQLGRGATALRDFQAFVRARDLTGETSAALRFRGDGPVGLMTGIIRLSRPEPQQIEISDILIDTTLATFTGGFILRPDSGMVTGYLDGISGDLAVLQRGLDVEAGGAFSLQLRATETGGGDGAGQAATLAIQGRDMTLVLANREAVTTSAFDFDAAIETRGGLLQMEALREARGQAALAGFRSSTLMLDSLAFTFGGNRDQPTTPWSLTLDGNYFGPLTLQGQGSFVMRESRAEVNLAALSGMVRRQPLQLTKPVLLTLDGRSVLLDGLDLTYGDGRITARYLSEPGRLDLAARAEDVSLSLVPLIFDLPPFRGTASGGIDLTVAGGQAEGRIEVDAQVQARDASDTVDQPSVIRLKGAVARDDGGRHILSLAGEAAGEDLKADLTARLPLVIPDPAALPGLDAEAPVRAAVAWNGPLSLITAALPPMDHVIGGRLDARLDLQGSVSDPALTGQVVLNDGRYENISLGTVLEQVAATVALDGRTLTLDTLEATDGDGGRVTGSGAFTLGEDWRPVGRVTVKADSARLVRTTMVTADIDGEAAYQRSVNTARVTGDLVAEPVEVNLVDEIPTEITTLDVREINRPGGDDPQQPGPPQIRQVTALDLRINAPRRVWVRGRGLDSEWQGDLKVGGAIDAPSVAGTLTLLRGTFEFAGRDFDLTQGSLRFSGGRQINPLITLRAEYSTSDLTAVISVQGPIAKPDITLTSNPTLPQDEILARILFGSAVHQLSALEAVQLGSAVSSLSSGGGGFDVFGKARGLLGLDRLSVGLGGENGEGGNLVTGGKYLTKNVYLEIRTDTQTGESTATVRFDVTRNLQLESDVGADNQTGVGIRWKKDY